MRISEELSIFWGELRLGQKAVLVFAGLLIASVLISGWISSVQSWSEIRRLENEAAEAKAEADAAVKAAIAIGEEKKKLEVKISSLEEQRNAKQPALDNAMRDADAAAADWERARREQRKDNPSTDELCAELAELGYPC